MILQLYINSISFRYIHRIQTVLKVFWTHQGIKEQHKQVISHVLNDRFKKKYFTRHQDYQQLISCSRSVVSQTCLLDIVQLEWLISVVFCSHYLTVITRTEFTLKFSEPWGQVDTWTSLSASNNNDITTMLIPHAVSFIGWCANCIISLMFLEIPKLQIFVQLIYAHHKLGLLTLFYQYNIKRLLAYTQLVTVVNYVLHTVKQHCISVFLILNCIYILL